MKSLEMIKNRYTTKSYDDNYNLPDGARENIIEILRYSPSSINSQPWKFYIVENKDVKNQLAKVSYSNDKKLQDCSLAVVFSALKVKELEKRLEEFASPEAFDFYKNYVKPMGEQQIQAWIEKQVYISLGFLLACLGSDNIDSSALEGIDTKSYMEILGIDSSKEKVLFAVAVGRRANDDRNQPNLKEKSRLGKNLIVKEFLQNK